MRDKPETSNLKPLTSPHSSKFKHKSSLLPFSPLPLRKILIMKKGLIALVIFTTTLCGNITAQQLRTPAPSPTQTIKQDLGVGTVEVTYSRPSVKGRTIFGTVLAPYDKVWRTGANQATIINFSDTVMIGGSKVAPGKYGLVSIPRQAPAKWTIIITKQLDITSHEAYDAKNDVAKMDVSPITLPFQIETFAMQFGNMTQNSCNLELMWDKTYVALPISVMTDARVMADINKIMIQDNKPYYNAASYYYDNNKDMKQALVWAQKAADANPKAFWVIHLLAKIQAKMGDKTNALMNANKSLQLSQEAKNDNFVKMNEELIKSLN
jgi:Protein of unknown function (DUF2911)